MSRIRPRGLYAIAGLLFLGQPQPASPGTPPSEQNETLKIEHKLRQLLHKSGCAVLEKNCLADLATQSLDPELNRFRNALNGQHVEALYYPPCKKDLVDARLHPFTDRPPISPVNGSEALVTYHQADWFSLSRTKQIWLICRESCSKPICPELGNPDWGFLAKARCRGVEDYLTRMLNLDPLHKKEDADRIVIYPTACNDKLEPNPIKRAYDQSVLILFLPTVVSKANVDKAGTP